MKIIKLLLTLSLICLTYTLESNRVVKTSTSSKARRVQSMATSKMAAVFTLSFHVGTNTVPSIGTIDAKLIKNPKGESVRGIEIAFSTINEDIKPLLYQVGTKWYLPYRKLAQAFMIQEVNAGGKILNSQLLESKNHLHNLRIQFEFDPEWEVITDSELNTLVTWMNTNRSDRRAIVSSLKVLALQYAGEYKSATESAKAGDLGVQGVSTQIETGKRLVKDTESLKQTATDSLKNLVNNIEKQQLLIDALQAKLVESKKQMDLDDKMIIEKQRSGFRLNTAASAGRIEANDFNAEKEKAETGFRNGMANLQDEIGNGAGKDKLLLATTKLFTDKDLSGCTNTIRSVFPL